MDTMAKQGIGINNNCGSKRLGKITGLDYLRTLRQERREFQGWTILKSKLYANCPDIQRILNMAGSYSTVKIQVVFLFFKLFGILFLINDAKLNYLIYPANTPKMVFFRSITLPAVLSFSIWEWALV
jgi:hypothetical protein